ncbi:hypothetical protein T12_11536 [Trichinella patagoniensis]|uniref:Uncharacterized protein n=1 Tax=Trichinella patagoniensis TaxID=990121 RepID=A0A0V1A7W1_9BILA|nr:hypothetical protein T12_11536 [Trichinella patagoniensis]
MGEDVIVMVGWGRIWKNQTGKLDTKTRHSDSQRHVRHSNLHMMQKADFVGKIDAQNTKQKYKANEVRRTNNGAFNAMTDEEDH